MIFPVVVSIASSLLSRPILLAVSLLYVAIQLQCTSWLCCILTIVNRHCSHVDCYVYDLSRSVSADVVNHYILVRVANVGKHFVRRNIGCSCFRKCRQTLVASVKLS